MSKVRFCWLCGKKLRGTYCQELTIDNYPRTLHIQCAKEVEKEFDFRKIGKQYFSMIWSVDEGYF